MKLDHQDHDVLTALAKHRHPRVARWYGAKSTSSRRVWTCYICDAVIDAESSRHNVTKRAVESIALHRQHHLDQLSPLLADAVLLADLAGADVAAWVEIIERDL